jgi:glutamate racemase
MDPSNQPIGVFDSGYGGLTVLRAIVKRLPGYDYLYLGDNARTPYGNRSFETVYHYTLQCVQYLFDQGCRLVIIACNTASAKALRTIQQQDLPLMDHSRRVLGVIRPTTEIVGKYTRSGSVGVMATHGTVSSRSYPIEIGRFFPHIRVFQQACPMWVPLVENHEFDSPGADYFVKKYIDELFGQSADIDTIVLGCTHYPLLIKKIQQFLPGSCMLLSQGEIVAHSLADYLHRHPEIEEGCSKNGNRDFCTTDSTAIFNHHATVFWGHPVVSRQVVF